MNLKGNPTIGPGSPFQSHESVVAVSGLGHDPEGHLLL